MILLFLRDWRSTIVAMVAIPVSIIAAFMVMSFFNASINVLTLLAIVLAIGIVVDDAIVEIENVHRRIEEGQPPLLASFDGAREIGFAVIATTATLMAVFVPLAFMPGNTGKLFREFAITLAASIFFSGVVARTLTPMLCSKLMVPAHGRIQLLTEPVFTRMNDGYRWLLTRALRAPLIILAVGVAVSFLAFGLFNSLKQEFSPIEDRGAIIVRIIAPEGASLDYTRDRVKEVERELLPFQEQGIIASHHQPARSGLRAALAGQRGHDHRAPRALGQTGHQAARDRAADQRQGLGAAGRAGQHDQSALPRPARRSTPRSSSCSAGPTTTPCANGATSSCRRRRPRACSSTWIPTTGSPSPTSASRSTGSGRRTSTCRSRTSAAPSN